MSDKEEERTPTVEILSSKRRYSFDSQDSLCHLRGDLSTIRGGKKKSDSDYTGWDAILDDISSKIAIGSKEDRQGWSPSINESSAAFFENYQEGYFSWDTHWPNKRLPVSHRTSTAELYGCTIIEVALEEDNSEQVPSCTVNPTSRQGVPNDRGPSEFYSYCKQVQGNLVDVSSHPKQVQGYHDTHNWLQIKQIVNQDHAHQPSRRELEQERFYLIQAYTLYVNRKRRRLVNVSLTGIDKTSSSYIPNRAEKGFYGASYCIKTIGNTFVFHQLGTVGFTVAEYFGQATLDDTEDSYDPTISPQCKNNTYNIVQVVHGYKFTHHSYVRVISRYKHNKESTIRKLIPGNYYYRTEFRNKNYYSKTIDIKAPFSMPAEYIEINASKARLTNIFNIFTIPHHNEPVPFPHPDSPNFEQEKKDYRLYRLFLGTTVRVENCKIYKYMNSRAYDSKSRYYPSNCLPINIWSHNHNRDSFRHWYFGQVKLWESLEDLRNQQEPCIVTLDSPQYPSFTTDFYKVRYMITRK